jgi:hypothetical protein
MSTMTVSPLAVSPLTARPPVRLTRRGRLLVAVLAVLVAVTGAVLLTGGASALAGTGGTGGSGSSGGPVAPAERVTVRPGETLWQIAERAAPGADPRETVQRILDLNGLQTSQVQAGTALRLP